MKMGIFSKRTSLSLGMVLLLGSSNLFAFNIDELIPAEPGGAVQSNNAVSSGETIVSDSMEEGFQIAHQQLMNQNTDGVRTIAVGSGLGILSTGVASYTTYDNINATLLSKQAAFNRAAMAAKQGLISFFGEPAIACNAIAENILVAVDTAAESVANSISFDSDQCATEVQASLSGYVTFDVHDDTKSNTARVSLISTAETRSATQMNVGSYVVGTDIPAMFDQVRKDLMRGVLPPVGGKIIAVSGFNETVVVGFGSAVNRQNRNASIQRSLARAAQQQATMRSNAALLGILTGEDVYHKGSFDESQVESSEQFVMDPALESEEGIRVLEQEQQSFMSLMTQSDSYGSAVEGNLPKGVMNRTFTSDDGYWTYAVAIYSPSLQSVAENSDGVRAPSTTTAQPATRALKKGGVNEDAENPQGASGDVSDPANL